MNAFEAVAQKWDVVLVFSLLATAAMTTVLEGAQLLGLTRVSLPFLFGTAVTGRRALAMVLGYVLYLIGGGCFAIGYAVAMEAAGTGAWWFGLLLGFGHGLFLIAVFLPLLPYIHPRMTTEYGGPDSWRRLEPPGAFGLHYGRSTPLSTVAAQMLFGLIMALGYSV